MRLILLLYLIFFLAAVGFCATLTLGVLFK